MKRLEVEPQLGDEELAALEGTHLDDSHWDTLVEDDCDVFAADTGNPLVCYRKDAISDAAVRLAYKPLTKVGGDASNRGTATGHMYSKHAHNLDGTPSKTNRVEVHKYPELKRAGSGVIGYMDRYVRFPFCRETAFNADHPELFKRIRPLIEGASLAYKHCLPVHDRYKAQEDAFDQCSPDFRISDTVFTTVTVNRNFRTAAHYDAGDLKAGFGVITSINVGQVEGSYTVMPKYRIAFRTQTRAVVMFDPHQLHGNTPLTGKVGRYQRIACVFYFREKMLGCKSAEEELARAKARQLGDSLYD